VRRGAAHRGQYHQATGAVGKRLPTSSGNTNDVKGRVEFQRHVVAQLHMVAADTGEAEAALDALSDDEASKLRILDYSETG